MKRAFDVVFDPNFNIVSNKEDEQRLEEDESAIQLSKRGKRDKENKLSKR